MGKTYLAIDLGAGSGRVIAAAFDGKKLSLEEVSRWESRPVKIGGSFHWDVDAIFSSILGGLRAAKAKYGNSIVSRYRHMGRRLRASRRFRQARFNALYLPRFADGGNGRGGVRQNSQG